MLVTLYKRPNGRTEQIDVRNIREEDERWFMENSVKISMEDIGVGFAIYADIGRELDGEPDEVIHITTTGQSCEDAMSKLREECDKQSQSS